MRTILSLMIIDLRHLINKKTVISYFSFIIIYIVCLLNFSQNNLDVLYYMGGRSSKTLDILAISFYLLQYLIFLLLLDIAVYKLEEKNLYILFFRLDYKKQWILSKTLLLLIITLIYQTIFFIIIFCVTKPLFDISGNRLFQEYLLSTLNLIVIGCLFLLGYALTLKSQTILSFILSILVFNIFTYPSLCSNLKYMIGNQGDLLNTHGYNSSGLTITMSLGLSCLYIFLITFISIIFFKAEGE